jgi:hypothetical protein
MKKTEKLLLAATAGLGLVLAVAGLPGKGKGTAPAGAPGPAAAAPAAPPEARAASPPALELLLTKRAELRPVPPGMRDPFRPPNTNPVRADAAEQPASQTGAQRLAELKLTGVFEEAGEPAALINGKQVRVGDIIGGLRVEEVTSHSVRLEYRGERFVLDLYDRPRVNEKTGGSKPSGGRDGTEPAGH